ncbi:GNAT family N-acetyltransferase [Candidatus Sororendozoicomonas aggregata]|uniref:GNAT family N-acetyltransferase n=1 Tax=Candidatus Sororendozoicomonas aggregata TaxID=3073239 RepID=UPI002ED13F4D
MGFELSAIKDQSIFKHNDGQFFLFERINKWHSRNKLHLRLITEYKENDDYDAGYIIVSYGDSYHNQRYVISTIAVDPAFQKLYLGSLLMYAAIKEVMINQGVFLYVFQPFPAALGFYIKLGFFPDPEGVIEEKKPLVNPEANLTGRYVIGEDVFYDAFDEKGLMYARLGRKHRYWQANVETAHNILYPKIISYFTGII